ncbi:BMP family lipoprotein [Salinarchaeum laminariae]|uniref:BMP family lipoprotein n=1 Tax=Salinarchaeum laminariae TaxID=869888 RepID=UPI0020BEE848|nr:BMP family ABC transporter substrate-binding protein [Salinarchaeum laminariae]
MSSNGGDDERTDESTASGRQSRINRRNVLRSGAVVGGAALAGCLSGSGGGDSDDDGDGGNGSDGGNGGGTTNVAIVSSSAGFDDQAFNTLAVEGLEAAAEDYDMSIQEVEETSPSNYETTQADLASSSNPNYDLIVLVGYEHSPGLQTNAAEYSDQNWMLINDHVDQPNVAGRIWANHEMSYLAGVAAGTMTTRDFSFASSSTQSGSAHIGFVGGVDGPLINAFEDAYVAGAEWVNSDVEVSVGYVGNYQDTQTATNIASSQYDDGADIVYQAAAAAGEGVFPAAQSANRFAIGVDADQSVTLSEYQDVIMGSAVKFINEGTRSVASAVAEGNFDSVAGRQVLGLEEEAVEFVPGQTVGEELPDDVASNVDEATQAIVDGEITVPCSASGCN